MSSTPITTEARQAVATAYIAAGLTAIAYTPAAIVPPLVVVEPGDPWVELALMGDGKLRGRVRLLVSCYVSAIDNGGGLTQLEALVERVIKATPSGVAIESVGPPVEADSGSQGVALTAPVVITALVEEG